VQGYKLIKAHIAERSVPPRVEKSAWIISTLFRVNFLDKTFSHGVLSQHENDNAVLELMETILAMRKMLGITSKRFSLFPFISDIS
jgi:hypothetical protein